MTTVVGKGGAKSKNAIPVRSPSVAVVRVGEGKAELARGRWRPDQAEREGSGRQERMIWRVISA